jgi:hypothetical protein
MKARTPKITFVTIATGRYLNFWEEQIESAKKFIDLSFPLEFVLLTDDIEKVNRDIFNDSSWDLKIGKIQHQVWPYPTLFKFRHIARNRNLISSNFIWHLDADMLFARSIDIEKLISAGNAEKIILVKHPGYYRPKFIYLAKEYLLNPSDLFRDLRIYIKYGALGTWDLHRQSSAFVHRKMRKIYCCGGSWGGNKREFFSMCEELDYRISQDLDTSYIAKFHDESHINWYAANRNSEILDPGYCFELTYKFLSRLEPRIIAVDKNNGQNWDRYK